MIYLDTSALVKLAREELETPVLLDWLNAHSEDRVASKLVELELPRALRRSGPAEALGAMTALLSSLSRIEISAAVRATAGAYTDPYLRTLDAIHLATADQLRASGKTITAFVAYDKRLLASAKAAGLPAISPGS